MFVEVRSAAAFHCSTSIHSFPCHFFQSVLNVLRMDQSSSIVLGVQNFQVTSATSLAGTGTATGTTTGTTTGTPTGTPTGIGMGTCTTNDVEHAPTNKRARSLSSPVWNFFERIPVDSDGKEKAQCKGCGSILVGGGNKSGTSSLKRHIEICESIPKFHETDVGKLVLDHAGKLRSRMIDQKVVRDLVAKIIIEHDLPFSFTEYRRVRELLKYLNADVKIYSRRMTTIDVINLYEQEKGKVKEALSRIPSRVCLSSDVWTSCTSEGYISLTAHFVDEHWKLNSKILNFCHFPPPHSGTELARVVFDFLQQWGIERKVFSLTLDNASANDNMQEILKERLVLQNDGLLCGGEFFHIRCCAHILNLIVQEGMKVATSALYKVRESIKYIKGSEARMNAFKSCAEQIGGINTTVGLRLDVTTRWNSTYMMLESAIPYRRAFCTYVIHDKHYKHCPTSEEWKRAEKMCAFLKPFYEITNLMSCSSYPTSNLYFLHVWKIECLLLENLTSEDCVIRDMTNEMQEKFDKYWKEYSIVLALATVLDPRLKFPFLDYCYKKLGIEEMTLKAKLNMVKHKLYMLFNEYSKKSSQDAPSSGSHVEVEPPQEVSGSEQPLYSDALMEYIAYDENTVVEVGKSQLDKYLEEPKLNPKYHQKLDVLQYWKENKARYPDLALMACDILSIPITTVASESAFGIGSRILTKYRSSMLPENVQALICTRNWLLGFNIEENDVEPKLDDLPPKPRKPNDATQTNIIMDDE